MMRKKVSKVSHIHWGHILVRQFVHKVENLSNGYRTKILIHFINLVIRFQKERKNTMEIIYWSEEYPYEKTLTVKKEKNSVGTHTSVLYYFIWSLYEDNTDIKAYHVDGCSSLYVIKWTRKYPAYL